MDKNEERKHEGLGYDYAHPTSRLAHFIDEQHRLLERARNEVISLSHDFKKAKEEAEYWRLKCNAAELDTTMMRAAKVSRGCEIEELKEEIRQLKEKK